MTFIQSRIIFALSIAFIVLLNCFRFFNLNEVPPGFFVDEAAGATQIICIGQTGYDFYGDYLPLFPTGASNGLYTPLYTYISILWTSLFGYSPAAFRSFLGFVTCLTILFLYLWAKRIGNERFAIYVALAASISPWAFHFSRIAWDPPLAVFFLVLGLWASTFRKYYFVAGLFFAGAMYTYGPMRISVILLLIFLPAIKLKQKIMMAGAMLFACIPLFIELAKPYFIARSKFVGIWGQHGLNPYADYSPIELVNVFFSNLAKHLSVDFMWIYGDGNPRHGVPGFGVLSWLDAAAAFLFLILVILYVFSRLPLLKRVKTDWASWQYIALVVGIVGVLANLIPSALTINTPHSLRSIGAWPFISILTGLIFADIDRRYKSRFIVLIAFVIGASFFGIYVHRYFGIYAQESAEFFHTDQSKIVQAYPLLAKREKNCNEVEKEPKPKPVFAPLRPKLNSVISFDQAGYGKNYLGDGWHGLEPWGVWSAGEWAELTFFEPMENPQWMIINAKALVSPLHPALYIEAWSGGRKLGSYALRQNENNEIKIPISKDMADGELLKIKLKVINPISPTAAKISEVDNRVLGLGLQSLQFQ